MPGLGLAGLGFFMDQVHCCVYCAPRLHRLCRNLMHVRTLALLACHLRIAVGWFFGLGGWVSRWSGRVGLCSPRAASTPCSPLLACLASAVLPRSAVVWSLLACRFARCCCCPLLPISLAPLLVQAQELTKDSVRSRESCVPRIHWLCQALKHG